MLRREGFNAKSQPRGLTRSSTEQPNDDFIPPSDIPGHLRFFNFDARSSVSFGRWNGKISASGINRQATGLHAVKGEIQLAKTKDHGFGQPGNARGTGEHP